MAEAPDKPVYLITGRDRPKIETALERLRAHFAPEAIEFVTAVDTSGDDAVGLCNAGQSLRGRATHRRPRRRRSRDGEGRRKGGWKAADVTAVTDYLASPAPATVLALVAEELKSSAALWKACAKTGTVLSFEVAKKELHGWVAEQFRQRGVRAEPEAVSALILLVGDDLTTLKTEVDKLAIWAAGEPIGEREVETLVAANADVPTYELTEAWSARRLRPRARRERVDLRARVAAPTGCRPAARGLARQPRHPDPRTEAARGRGCRIEGGCGAPEAASVPHAEADAAGGGLLSGGARRRGGAARRARRRPEGAGRLAPDLEVQRPSCALSRRRPGAAAPCRQAAALGGAGDEMRRARLLASGGVLVKRATRRRAVDRSHELAMLVRDPLGVAVGDGSLEALREGLDRRSVAEVLASAAAPGSGRASSAA